MDMFIACFKDPSIFLKTSTKTEKPRSWSVSLWNAIPTHVSVYASIDNTLQYFRVITPDFLIWNELPSNTLYI